MIRQIYTAFFISLLSFIYAFQALAGLPEISKPIDEGLFNGTREEIEKVIGKREELVNRVLSEVKEIIARSSKDHPEKKALFSDTLDALTSLSFQFARLKTELARPLDFPFSLPEPGLPPYSLEIFDKTLNVVFTVEQRLSECSADREKYDEKLSAISDNLKSALLEYTKTRSKDTRDFSGYGQFAQILSLQIEYALLQVKNSKNNELFSKLVELKTRGEKQAKTLFENLKITKKDIEKAKSALEKARSEEKKKTQRLSEKYRQENKKIILVEIRLDKIIKQLSSGKLSEASTYLLRAEKERLEIVIEEELIRQKYIRQQKLMLHLKKVEAAFRYDWITTYAGISGAKTPVVFIAESGDVIKDLDTWHDDLTRLILDISTIKTDLAKKETLLTENKNNISKKAFSNIYAQLEKTINLTNTLFLKTAENKYLLKKLKETIKRIVDLMRNRASLLDRMKVWSKHHLQKAGEELKGILYYPLITVGSTTLTLSSILKTLVLLFIGIAVLKILRRKITNILFKKANLSYGAVNSITTLVYYASLVLVALVAMSTAGLDLSQLSIILGALGVGIGFGLQNIANNFVSGLILLSDRSVRVGDIITLEDNLTGEVKKLAIRATVIRTQDGEDIIVPNSEFISNRLRTWTYDDNWRRLKIRFGVSYDADPDVVRKIAIEAAREVPITVEDEDHPIRVWFEGFGDNSIDFAIRVWCRMNRLQGNHGLMSAYYYVLFRKLKEAGIEIPYPQRDVHVRTLSSDILEQLKHMED